MRLMDYGKYAVGVGSMKHILKLYAATALLCWLGLVINIAPAQAGDPDKTVGPADPTHLVCADKNSHLIIDLPSDAVDFTGYNPEAKIDIDQLKRECQEAKKHYKAAGLNYDLALEYARQSRIEGFVFEFHPDPAAPGGWLAVPSQSVPVVASGPGFEVFWGSDKDGSFYFNNLGAGPVTLNLRLPPDAHPLNPNITVMTSSFPEVWKVELAFYRGEVTPEDFDALRLPLGYTYNALVPGDTIIDVDKYGGYSYMPSVGGILPPNQPVSILILAGVVLITLPTVGFIALRRKRAED
jgi:hypothetical protein